MMRTQGMRSLVCSTLAIIVLFCVPTAAFSVSNTEDFKQLRISFVTGNQMKVGNNIGCDCHYSSSSLVFYQANEVIKILAEHGATRGPTPKTSLVDLIMLNVDLPEIQEVNTMAIAKDKALLAAQLANGPCVVEDTSLQFNALGGMPGPYIK